MFKKCTCQKAFYSCIPVYQLYELNEQFLAGHSNYDHLKYTGIYIFSDQRRHAIIYKFVTSIFYLQFGQRLTRDIKIHVQQLVQHMNICSLPLFLGTLHRCSTTRCLVNLWENACQLSAFIGRFNLSLTAVVPGSHLRDSRIVSFCL